jgi:hypothetical protein
MNRVCSIFAQLLGMFPRTDFEGAVQQHQAERHARGFTCWGQFVAMLFCHMGQAQPFAGMVESTRLRSRVKYGKDQKNRGNYCNPNYCNPCDASAPFRYNRYSDAGRKVGPLSVKYKSRRCAAATVLVAVVGPEVVGPVRSTSSTVNGDGICSRW